MQEQLAEEQMEVANLEKSEGPLVQYLDTTLKEMNVERQAYHGKSFIGNHVHTWCKVTCHSESQNPKTNKQTNKQLNQPTFLCTSTNRSSSLFFTL